MLGTIVLADDSKTVRRMVEIALHKHPFQLEVATDAAAALELVRSRHPTIVLVDTHLGDGYGLARQMKDASPGVKVCLMAGQHQVWDADRGTASGADAHLVKPFLTQDLLDAVYQASAGKPAPNPELFRDAPSAIPLARKPEAAKAAPAPPPRAPAPPAAVTKPSAPPPRPPAPPPVAATANPFSGVQSPFEQNEPTRPFFKAPDAPGFESAATNVAPPPPAAIPLAAPAQAAAGVILNDASLKEALAGISKEQIERMLWEILPPLAEAILKEEIARVVRERMAAQ